MLQNLAHYWINDSGVQQLKIGKTVCVLHSFVWNYVKYANMEVYTETVTYFNEDQFCQLYRQLIDFIIGINTIPVFFSLQTAAHYGFIPGTCNHLIQENNHPLHYRKRMLLPSCQILRCNISIILYSWTNLSWVSITITIMHTRTRG